MRTNWSKWSYTGALLAIAGLGGCSLIGGADDRALAKAKERVGEKLKDPTSAIFSELHVTEDKYVCGYVNAKNSYGGYVGRERFLIDPEGKELKMENQSSSTNPGIQAQEACEFQKLFPACMAGKQMLTFTISMHSSNGDCKKKADDAIDAAFGVARRRDGT
ncbi:hypothetical protein [Sphingomonas trueperi]|uniref:hypothetical protein n=1 Tax=Sphingomonas trueperi TaxID=53317 RepID=UPI000F1F31E0